ncbi:hypothetical protein C8R47DRAFT_492883 [Mycena vitilis]|nr:hypothetical protein C8R47DRAFT_492883 [Mycena vitilis]
MEALPIHDAWARSGKSTIILAGNTKQVPALPCWNLQLAEVARCRIDGRWGMAEYSVIPQPFDAAFPYLAWMPKTNFARLGFSTKINSFDINEDVADPNAVFVRHSGWKHRGHLRTEIREELQKDVVEYIHMVRDIIHKEADPHLRIGLPEVRPPVIALVRSHNSAFCMRFPHLTYRDLLEYTRGLQRSVAELQAYVMWYDRMHYADLPTSNRSFELGLRGSIAGSRTEYNTLRKLGAPVWLELSVPDNTLDAHKRVDPTAMHVERRTWDQMQVSLSLRDTQDGKVVHNKPLEYYPPSVDALTTYELAARGYAPRQDVVCRDLRSLKDVLSMVESVKLSGANHNRSPELALQVREAGNSAGELMEKYAADRAIVPTAEVLTPQAAKKPGGGKSKWFRQYLETHDRYTNTSWAPKFVEAWSMASKNNGYYPLLHDVRLEPKCKDLLLYLAPPPHLFLGVAATEKQCNYFFIWMCIRRAWLSSIRHTFDSPISWGLTTQTWRDVMSGHYWKLRHSKEGPVQFDVRMFWRQGGPLIFEEGEIGDSEDIAPRMPSSPTGRLEPSTFLDNNIKALVLWDLTLCHSQLQLDRADEILCATDAEDEALSIRRIRRADIFHDPDWNWNIPNKTPPWEYPLAHKTRRHWLSRLLEVLKGWPCSSKMEWFLGEHNFSGMQGPHPEAMFCDSLSDAKLHLLEMSMIAVLYQGVFDALGILAIGVIRRPVITAEMHEVFTM